MGFIANRSKQVEFVEADTVLRTASYFEQSDAPWNLARISHREKGADNYIYEESAGEGTCVYVVDTGLYTDHDVSAPINGLSLGCGFSDVSFTPGIRGSC